jgi:hypothetical protein
MMIVHGERERLQEILASEDFTSPCCRAGYTVPNLTCELMVTGDDAVAQMGLWASIGSELDVM